MPKAMTNYLMEKPLSIYLHIPFCTSKCTYCAFNTYIKLEHLIDPFVEALSAEIATVAKGNPYAEVRTIYFGGGTPSLLRPEQFSFLLEKIHENFKVQADAEVSTETNPNDLDENYLMGLRQAGINRLSMGMQTSNPAELKFFARRHEHSAVIHAVEAARSAGFDNINLDLMYGFPYQTLDTWHKSIDDVLILNPEHISLYALGLEEGTPLNDWVENKQVPIPDDDLAADMYDLATELLGTNGYQQYEISNWAKPGYECQHNLQYWRNWPYIGLGPGAHGYANGVRYDTILGPQQYVRAMSELPREHSFPKTPATNNAVVVPYEDDIGETLMMGLRLMHEGIIRDDFASRFHVDLMELHGPVLHRFEQQGLLSITDERVCLTEKGRLLSNAVFRELI